MFTPEELALELGGKIKYADGTVFNSAGRSGVHRLPKPVAVPQPAPVVAPQQDNSELLAKVVALLAREQPAAVAPAVNVPAPVVTVQPAPRVLDWTFTFEHNRDGSIKSIRAKAT
jgi:hypothetical protein